MHSEVVRVPPTRVGVRAEDEDKDKDEDEDRSEDRQEIEMMMNESWDARPEAVTCPVMRCVVCGEYVGSRDLWGIVRWGEFGDGSSVSPVIGYHVGRCVMVLDKVLEADGGQWSDDHVGQMVKHLVGNLDEPLVAGKDGLVRVHREPLDLLRTQRLLEMMKSPLLRDSRVTR